MDKEVVREWCKTCWPGNMEFCVSTLYECMKEYLKAPGIQLTWSGVLSNLITLTAYPFYTWAHVHTHTLSLFLQRFCHACQYSWTASYSTVHKQLSLYIRCLRLSQNSLKTPTAVHGTKNHRVWSLSNTVAATGVQFVFPPKNPTLSQPCDFVVQYQSIT